METDTIADLSKIGDVVPPEHRKAVRDVVPPEHRKAVLGGNWLRFLRAYFDRPLRDILIEEADLLAHLAREGTRLTERYRRKFAPQGAS